MKTRKKFSLSVIIEIDINIFVRKVKKHKERRYIVSFVNFKEKLIVRFNMNHRKSSRLSCILFFFFLISLKQHFDRLKKKKRKIILTYKRKKNRNFRKRKN